MKFIFNCVSFLTVASLSLNTLVFAEDIASKIPVNTEKKPQEVLKKTKSVSKKSKTGQLKSNKIPEASPITQDVIPIEEKPKAIENTIEKLIDSKPNEVLANSTNQELPKNDSNIEKIPNESNEPQISNGVYTFPSAKQNSIKYHNAPTKDNIGLFKIEEEINGENSTKIDVAKKDDRADIKSKYGNTMHHAEVDSDLILNRYEKKQFIKEKITEIAKSVVKKEIESKKSIADQMGPSGSRKISVSIDETVAIKDAIMEVSNLTGIDVEVDPEVEGSIIISVKNTKAADVFERMAELAQLNISVKGGVIRFTSNKSFTKNYSVSFIDNMNTGINNSQMISPSVGTNGNINVNPYNNQQLNQGFNAINPMANNIYGNQQYGMNGMGGNMNMMGFNGGVGMNSLTSLQSSSVIGGFNMNNSMWDQFENGLKYIVSQKKDVSYSINKQAGIVTLRAPLIIHKEFEEYIDKVKKVATTQILVEVRLVEVKLNDEFATGVNFNGNIGDGNWGISNKFNATPQSAISKTPFAITFSGGGLNAAVQFLQSFGTTKAIASPRLNVMNNQKSRLSFAKDSVYFAIQPQLQNQYINMSGTTSGATNPIIVQSTMHTVPIGVILDLQATADIEKDEITMNIRPVLSSIVDYANDPAATFLSSLNTVSAGSQITNAIPVIEKKELNSTLRIKSGDIMVIGGFNEEKTVIQRAGIPYLKDIPYLKVLFGFNTKSVANIETVIFIKATIMTPEKSINEQDVKFYNDFA